jgi:hypothetical protein
VQAWFCPATTSLFTHNHNQPNQQVRECGLQSERRDIYNSKFAVRAVQVQTLIRRPNTSCVNLHNRGKTPFESTCFPLVSQMYVFTLAEEALYLKRNGAASVSTRQELPGYRVASVHRPSSSTLEHQPLAHHYHHFRQDRLAIAATFYLSFISL